MDQQFRRTIDLGQFGMRNGTMKVDACSDFRRQAAFELLAITGLPNNASSRVRGSSLKSTVILSAFGTGQNSVGFNSVADLRAAAAQLRELVPNPLDDNCSRQTEVPQVLNQTTCFDAAAA